ncbi:hypothetical protein Mag101_07560 [Microbulbifer agarilyticus]|uniref:Phytanoyl-CoA dioxygenase n=1 Tax=Microbulbifer agarilyticus TaxID=260552 RepID=A0A1Q2M4C4_9GAMM|nr:hypothetical protein [Microbulbifer agarilyticus]AQQ67509.1 hypothetical protein Mag101_07560 [Microbulbifer agarilyticus]
MNDAKFFWVPWPTVRVKLNRVRRIFRGLHLQPGYTLMRWVARFELVRNVVSWAHGLVNARKRSEYRQDCKLRFESTVFKDLDSERMVRDLNQAGVAFGLKLPSDVVDGIRSYATNAVCYADRNPACGFTLDTRSDAESKLEKPILVAQYFNAARDCPEIQQLINDPVIRGVASDYLGSVPTFVGANLWWTFPVDALDSDKDRHAHLYHRDVDDFRFFKFFFYLTDVEPGDGAHMCVKGSHTRPPKSRFSDKWSIRRYTDREVEEQYAGGDIQEICGSAGVGFAENTLCIHKGLTPTRQARLILQLQFALFDYGAMHDRRPEESLRLIK